MNRPGPVFKQRMVLFVLSALLLAPGVSRAETIRIGSISGDVAEEIRTFLPFATYLARHLNPEGIEEGKVVVAKSIPRMADLLREGRVDLYIDSPFPSMAVGRLSGSRMFLRRWKNGIGEYHAVIFSRKGSGIRRIKDLKGQMIAFEEPFSSSSYLLPKMILVQAGLRLSARTDAKDAVRPDEVGYLFSNGDENTMLWVLRGKVAAGAMNFQTFSALAAGHENELNVLHETAAIPRHVVSHRPNLRPGLVERIRDILIRMDQSAEGRKILDGFDETRKFDDIPEETMKRLSGAQDFIDAEFRTP